VPVDDRPFLRCAEANALIDPIGIESLAVDHEPELLPIRRPGLRM
jgi:hypothetical protein